MLSEDCFVSLNRSFEFALLCENCVNVLLCSAIAAFRGFVSNVIHCCREANCSTNFWSLKCYEEQFVLQTLTENNVKQIVFSQKLF